MSKQFFISACISLVAGICLAEALVVDSDMTVSTSYSDGVSFAGDHTLTVAAGTSIHLGVIRNEGHQVVIRLEPNAQPSFSYLAGTASSCTKLEFNGGWLRDAGGWGSAWFMPDASSTVELASVGGNPILLTHPNSQWKYLVMGEGKVCTSGAGRLEIQTAGIHNGTVLFCYLNAGGANFGHTGGTVLRGNTLGTQGQICLNASDQLPPGLVELGASSGGVARIFMGNTRQYAQRIVGYGGISYLTNQTAAATTLVFTNDNALLDATLGGPSFNVKMKGTAASDTLTVKTPRITGSLTLEAGRMLLQRPRTDDGTHCATLRVGAGTALEIDGVVVTADTYLNEGGTVTTKNGGRLVLTSTVDVGNAVYDGEAARLSGASTFIKDGLGTLLYAGNRVFEPDAVHVAAGTLRFTGPTGTTNHWWRFTVKQAVSAGTTLSIGPMRLLDADLHFADGAGQGANGSQAFTAVAAGTAPSAFQPKQYLCSSMNYSTTKSGSDTPYPPTAIWNSSSVYDCTFVSPKPSLNDPASWITWTYRLPDAPVTVCGYNLKTQWGSFSSWPRSWKLESSPSGADGTWELMDERTGYTALEQGQKWYNGGGYGVGSMDGPPATKIAFDAQTPTLDTRGGLAADCAVQVDGGAELDCTKCVTRPVLSALTLDCAKGGGTLRNVALASTGTLDLVGFTGTRPYVLPYTFVDSVTAGSLSGWTVRIDGVDEPDFRLAWQNGRLCLPLTRTVLLIR